MGGFVFSFYFVLGCFYFFCFCFFCLVGFGFMVFVDFLVDFVVVFVGFRYLFVFAI